RSIRRPQRPQTSSVLRLGGDPWEALANPPLAIQPHTSTMSMQQFLDTVRSFDGVLELAPTEGSEFPEIAWGDHFFYYAPDGRVPGGQPYATFVTKDYPGDTESGLDAPGRWRINVHVGKKTVAELVAAPEQSGRHGFGAADVLLPHPVY